jgi:hypothetical protein
MSHFDDAIWEGGKLLASRIASWDCESIEELEALLNDLRRFCEQNDKIVEDFVDLASLPTADIPDDVDTAYPVWAMDQQDNLLIGTDSFEIMTLDEYRKGA